MLFNCSLDKNAYCLSINDKRYNYLCNNFSYVGLNPPILYRGVRWDNGTNRGCVLGHIGILMMARTMKLPYVVIYEDDAYPREDAIWMFEKIKKYVPDDCGILKVGSSSMRGEHNKINEYVFQATEGTSFGSHAFIVRRELYDNLIQNMEHTNVPDIAMSGKYYKDSKFKPYGLFMNCMIFIQKNIDTDNIISCKGGQRYWFMHSKSLGGCTAGVPPPGFKDRIYENDTYDNIISIVRNDKWKYKKKTAIIKDNTIKTKYETGTLEPLTNSTWQIKWDDCDVVEYLKFDNRKDNTNFYTILSDIDSAKKFYKFLICVISYGRPLDAINRIESFLNSISYDRCCVSAVFTGIDKTFYDEFVCSKLKNYIDSNKASIEFCEDNNEFNMLERCLLNFKGEYDYFVNVDLDCIYCDDFLSIANKHINLIPGKSCYKLSDDSIGKIHNQSNNNDGSVIYDKISVWPLITSASSSKHSNYSLFNEIETKNPETVGVITHKNMYWS